MTFDSSVYPRVLCFAPLRTPRPRPGAPAPDGASYAMAEVAARVDALTRQLDAQGLRQIVVSSRPRGARHRERVGQRAIVRRVAARTGPAATLFPVAAAAPLLRLARTADLLHVHHAGDTASLALALATAQAWDIPFVVSAHATRADVPRPDARMPVLQALGDRVERAAVAHADVVIVPTRALAERLAAEGLAQRRIHVIAPDLPDGEAAGRILEIYRAIWARELARRVAIWHPTTG